MDELCARAMPYVKSALSGDSGPALSLGHDDSPVVRDLGNGLLVLYAVDTGQAFEFAQNRHLSAAGIDADRLHAAAMNNFLRFMAERARMQPHGSIFALFLDGNFEASLLLVDHLWEGSLAGHAPNGFVVAVPARDMLAFSDAASVQGIAELRGVIARVFPGGDHLISSELYRREGAGGCCYRRVESARVRASGRAPREASGPESRFSPTAEVLFEEVRFDRSGFAKFELVISNPGIPYPLPEGVAKHPGALGGSRVRQERGARGALPAFLANAATGCLPGIVATPLPDEAMRQLELVLGCPLQQVWARY